MARKWFCWGEKIPRERAYVSTSLAPTARAEAWAGRVKEKERVDGWMSGWMNGWMDGVVAIRRDLEGGRDWCFFLVGKLGVEMRK
jgi:hypothetical protein